MNKMIIDSIIDAIRKNPKVSIKDFLKSVDEDPIVSKYKDDILNITFSDLLMISGAKTEDEVIEEIIRHKEWLKQKSIKDIVTHLNLPKDLVVKAINYLRNDETQYPGKIITHGEKRGMIYTWQEK